MRPILKIILIVFLFLMLAGCSLLLRRNPFINDYMPLAVGNNWIYDVYPQNKIDVLNITVEKEVVKIDTIENKKCFLIKQSYIGYDTTTENYYHLRLSNDTLYSLEYDRRRGRYLERVDAIFSMEKDETAKIHLDIKPLNLPGKPDFEQLPVTGKHTE